MVTFSERIQQFINDGSINTIPNPAHSGYLCSPVDFLSELIRFLSMMQVLKVGVSNEIVEIKNNIIIANYSLLRTQSDDQLYSMMTQAIHRLNEICRVEGEKAHESGETTLSESYAWAIAGCILFLTYTEK